jgi:hypothetical protein
MTETQILGLIRSAIDEKIHRNLYTVVERDQYADAVILICGTVPIVDVRITIGRVSLFDGSAFCSASIPSKTSGENLNYFRELHYADPKFFDQLVDWVKEFISSVKSPEDWDELWRADSI